MWCNSTIKKLSTPAYEQGCGVAAYDRTCPTAVGSEEVPRGESGFGAIDSPPVAVGALAAALRNLEGEHG